MKKNNKNPHKTPEGYFDSFNERLMDKIVKEESSIPENDGFVVPDGYFKSFSTNITEPKVIELRSYRSYYMVAASIVTIALFTFFFNQKNTQKTIGFNDLAKIELETYFDENTIYLDSDEIANYIDLENVSTLDLMSGEIKDDTLLDYLDENIDDIENVDYEEYN